MPLGDDIMAGISAIIDRTKKAAGAGLEEIKSSVEGAGKPQQDVLGVFPTGPLKAAKGAFDIATSPVSGILGALGDAIESKFPKLKEAQQQGQILPLESAESVLNTIPMLLGSRVAGETPKAAAPRVPSAVENFVQPKTPLTADEAADRVHATAPGGQTTVEINGQKASRGVPPVAGRISPKTLPEEFEMKPLGTVGYRVAKKGDADHIHYSLGKTPEEATDNFYHFHPKYAPGEPKTEAEALARFDKATGYPGKIADKSPANANAPAPLPDVVKQTGDELHRLHGAITADRIEIGKRLEALPPEFKTREVDQRLYEKAERPEMQLSPEEQAGFEQHFEPMRREVQQLASVAKKMGYPIEDKEYMHRVLAGKVEHTDVKTGKTEGAMNTGGPEPLGEEGAISPVPQMGTGGRGLSKTTSTLRPRSLYVFEAEDGKRAVVSSPSPGYLTVWNKGKGQTVKWGDDLELGQPIMVNGKRLTVKNAKTSELEADTPYRFHKSAMVNMADALVKMRAIVRNIQYLDQLTKSPSWLEHATRAGGNRRPPPGWRTPKIPQLKDWIVEPRLADALDDFYKPGFDIDSLDWLRRANRFAVGSLFWNPIPHIENVAGHWYVGRGWDWVRPTQYAPLVKTSLRAIKSVITQDELYRDLLKKGSGLISGGVANKDFYLKMAKKFELDVQRDPSAWEKVGRTLGMGTYDLAKGWYGWMNNVLWQANDMFMLQRVIELEGKGMSRLEAIKEAEKHIPNYRIPTTVMGQRWIAQFMSDPAFMAFGRYRYGVWNSYSNMVKDTFGKSKTMEERREAMGNMMALGSLALVVYPAVSWGIEKLTGDKDARKMRRGPASIPDQVYGAATQPEKHWYDFLANQLTFAPVPKEMLEQITNRDSFTGRHIEEPGEHSAVRRATQRVEHAAESMVQPYQAVSRGVDKLQEEGVPRQALDQVIGIQEKTQKQKRGQAIGQKIERKQALKRRNRPRGLIEKFEGSLE